MTQSVENIRENVRKILVDRGMNIQDLAERSHITRAHLSKFLHGHRSISIEHADRVAEALEVPLSKLINPEKK